MKVLFVARKSYGTPTGASTITLRNLSLLKQQYGEDNVLEYWIEQHHNILNTLLNTLKLHTSGLSIVDLAAIVELIRKQQVGLVFIDNSLLGKLAKVIKDRFAEVKVYTFFHNFEYIYFLNLISINYRIWHLLTILAVRYNESRAAKFSDVLFFLNQRDKNLINRYYPQSAFKTSYLLPSGISDRLEDGFYDSSVNSTEKVNALFVGTYFYANYHGINWFIKKVLPHLPITLTIVGRNFPKHLKLYQHPQINLVGEVDDISTYYHEADFVVAPIFKGSGMKTKIAEALMFGKTIFGTSEAFEGYDLDYNKVGGLCNTNQQFINTIKSFIVDTPIKKYNTYSREAYKKYYDLDKQTLFGLPSGNSVKKNERIIIAELARTGLVHRNINQSMIEVIEKVFRPKYIELHAESTHASYLTVPPQTKVKTFFTPKGAKHALFNRAQILLKEIIFLLRWLRIIIRVKASKTDLVFITSALPITHYVIKLTCSWLPKHTQVWLLLHGEVENIRFVGNAYYNLLAKAIKQRPQIPNFKYVVLGDYIKNNLINEFKVPANQVISTIHPYQFNPHILPKEQPEHQEKITFGSIGVHTPVIKSSELIYALADRCKQEVERGEMAFVTVGKHEPAMVSFYNPWVTNVATSKDMLSPIAFENEVKKLDYLLFFASHDAYRFTASATMLDAIKYQIPVIGIRNDSLSYFFELGGKIGYMVENIEEMAELIREIKQKTDVQTYAQMQHNLKNMQTFFTVDYIASQLHSNLTND